jgi:hypothetical protein
VLGLPPRPRDGGSSDKADAGTTEAFSWLTPDELSVRGDADLSKAEKTGCFYQLLAILEDKRFQNSNISEQKLS